MQQRNARHPAVPLALLIAISCGSPSNIERKAAPAQPAIAHPPAIAPAPAPAPAPASAPKASVEPAPQAAGPIATELPSDRAASSDQPAAAPPPKRAARKRGPRPRPPKPVLREPCGSWACDDEGNCYAADPFNCLR